MTAPTARLYFYALIAASGPMSNPLIRRAVSSAIDREGIVAAALSGIGGVPAGTVYTAAGMGWAADIALLHDPAKSEALAAGAGAVKDGGVWLLDGAPLSIDIVIYPSRAALPPKAELTRAFRLALGVQAKVRVGDNGASNDAIAGGTTDMFLQARVTPPQGNPGAVLAALWESTGDSSAGRCCNPVLDLLREDSRTKWIPKGGRRFLTALTRSLPKTEQ